MFSEIIVNGVTYELPTGLVLFEDISFSINSKLTALVGPNGVGKSCLAKLIVGELTPTAGSVTRRKNTSYLAQQDKPPQIPLEEYLSQKYTWSIIGEKLLKGIDQTILCTNLSGGQWMKVRLASTLGEQFLILDEPTNDLDREAKLVIIDFLSQLKHGALIISHDQELLSLCDEILELSNRGLRKYRSGWSAYETEKQQESDKAEHELEVAKRERDRMRTIRITQNEKQEKRNRQGKSFADKTGMSKIEIGSKKRQAQASTGKIDAATMKSETEKIRMAHQAYTEMKIDPIMYVDLIGARIPEQKLVVEANEYNILFDDWLFKNDLCFSWRGNLRMAIKGANGSGKSTLINSILGKKFQTKGELRLGNLVTLYLDQKCSMLNENETVFANVRAHSNYSDSEIRNNLAKILFVGDQVFQKIHTLSGGERLRAALACGLLSQQKPELLILDEPTNNLDLRNIKFLENLITQFKGAVIIVSHDEVFLKNSGIHSELIL